ncbi:MAG: recombination protein NinG [Paludibacter sp.]
MGWENRARPKSKAPKSNRSKKIERLDAVFSKFIRRRDCGFGYGKCISCGDVIKFENCDNGHYENRKHMSLRFDEQNCNAQCRPCNRFDEGNKSGYRRGLIAKIGEKATDMLEIRKNNTCHLSEVELDLLIAEYKKKLQQIEQKRFI